MFKEASKAKVRFATAKGALSVEDLWDIPLTSANGVCLDNIAKGLSKELKESEEESFVVQKSSANATLELKFELVKEIIKDRLAEAERLMGARANKEKKEKLLTIIAEKEDEGLKSASVDELKKMVEALG